MIKLLDIHSQNKDGCVALLYADTKEEVPEFTTDLEVEGLPFPVLAGSLIVTSAFEYAFVMENTAIHWKGEDAPTPPVPSVPVTVTLDATASNAKLVVKYLDENGEIATANLDNANVQTQEITVNTGTTIIAYAYQPAYWGAIETTATNIQVGEEENGGRIYLVYIEGETNIKWVEPQP